MSEAVYLHKPILSVPVGGQFEQILNARYLERLGYGMYAREVTPEILADFLGRVPSCRQALASYHQDGNERMKAALEEQLARATGQRVNWDEITTT